MQCNKGRPRSVTVPMMLGLALFGRAALVQAEEVAAGDLATKWKVNDADPKSGIPSAAERDKDPLEFAYLLQDLAARGERAVEQRDWEGVVKYYEALAHAVPDVALPFGRLCLAYGELGKYAIAAGNCGKAVSLGGARVIDHFRMVEFALKKPEFSERDREEVEASLQHLREHAKQAVAGSEPAAPRAEADEPGSNTNEGEPRKRSKEELVAAIQARQLRKAMAALRNWSDSKVPERFLPGEVEFLECKLAVRLKDAERLGRCIATLREMKVSEAQLAGLEWTQALLLKDTDKASMLMDRLESVGLPRELLSTMRAQYAAVFPRVSLAHIGSLIAGGLVILGAVAALIFAHARRRRRTMA